MTSSNQSLDIKPQKSNQLASLIFTFSKDYIEHVKQQTGKSPTIAFDEQWPSPCDQERVEDNLSWQPVLMSDHLPLSFDNVENALEITLHQDIKDYFTAIYSETIEAKCSEGDLALLFAWNKDDFQRLQENIIGHILMKQRMKQEPTVFFAVTDEEDIIISVLNETGEVWVERVGCKPHKKIADSLSEFIEQLEPTLPKDITS